MLRVLMTALWGKILTLAVVFALGYIFERAIPGRAATKRQTIALNLGVGLFFLNREALTSPVSYGGLMVSLDRFVGFRQIFAKGCQVESPRSTS
jgi:hypothetical protein